VSLQATIQRALEAISDRDEVYASRLLEVALDELDLLQEKTRRPRCVCGAEFRWPGELEDHVRFRGLFHQEADG
jgi:hypothetical protein